MDLELIPIYLITSIPFFLIVYLLLKIYNSYQLKQKKLSQGIGRGVAGFQTGVRRVAVPQEILDRIRRGEEVSAEEITRAQEKMAMKSKDQSSTGSDDDANGKSKTKATSKVDEDWLPPSSTRRSKNSVAPRKAHAKWYKSNLLPSFVKHSHMSISI